MSETYKAKFLPLGRITKYERLDFLNLVFRFTWMSHKFTRNAAMTSIDDFFKGKFRILQSHFPSE